MQKLIIGNKDYHSELSKDNHFMYWRKKKVRRRNKDEPMYNKIYCSVLTPCIQRLMYPFIVDGPRLRSTAPSLSKIGLCTLYKAIRCLLRKESILISALVQIWGANGSLMSFLFLKYGYQ